MKSFKDFIKEDQLNEAILRDIEIALDKMLVSGRDNILTSLGFGDEDIAKIREVVKAVSLKFKEKKDAVKAILYSNEHRAQFKNILKTAKERAKHNIDFATELNRLLTQYVGETLQEA